MNFTEALTAALPDVAVYRPLTHFPKCHSKALVREHFENGTHTFRVLIPGHTGFYSFPAEQWQLLQLFDGERSYQQVADLFREQTDIVMSEEELRNLAGELEAGDFWYKAPQEQNIALMQKLASDRRKRVKKKSRYGDFSYLYLTTWDTDEYVTMVYRVVKFMYTRWFTVLSLLAMLFTMYIFIDRWNEIGHDTARFFNFTQKSGYDLLEFWVLTCVVLFVHEFAHGLTCKHYGGRVLSMGFLLIFLTPAFYTDITEGWVLGTKPQRVAMVVAGVWSELLICFVVTPVWWGTPPGTFVHEVAYKLMLISGIAVVLVNWNPLIKLDGYYILSEYLGVLDLKEASTAYLVALVKKYVWRLPVEVPYIPRRRRLGYAIYAFLSGVYSYGLLYIVARFAGNVFHHYTPEWSFIPALGVGYLLFRSRIKALVGFMKTVYLDKRDRFYNWLHTPAALATGAALLIFVLLPLWRDQATGRFALEPTTRAVLRASVPGTVVSVAAEEGQRISAGTPLVTLRNLQLQSSAEQAASDFRVASANAIQAQLRYADFGSAMQQREQLRQQSRLLSEQVRMLKILSPISGTVLTPRLKDLVGSYASAGTELAEVAETGVMRARIYVPEYELRHIGQDGAARLNFDGLFGTRGARLVSIAPASSAIAAGLIENVKYEGIRPPNYFVATLDVSNADGELKSGMTGTAKLYGVRRSIAAKAWRAISEFAGRKVW